MPARGPIRTTLNCRQVFTDQKVVPVACPIRCVKEGHQEHSRARAWPGSRVLASASGQLRRVAISFSFRTAAMSAALSCV